MTGEKHTPAETIVWLLDFAPSDFWLDGGWGVDALIGRQTRQHEDIDIVIEQSEAKNLVPRLLAEGVVEFQRDDTRACNFVLGCTQRGLIDFHLINFDARGDGLYGIPETEGVYPAEAFTGRGNVLGSPVRCMSVAFQVASHDTGYFPRDKDHADMRARADAFSVSLPARYAENR